MNMKSEHGQLKVTRDHLGRAAYVYVRQSSLGQVRNNIEGQRLQYGFVQQAAALGWSEQHIVIVDEDQGRSASVAESRRGFAGIFAAVARREVGIVMSFELSRLSRNDLDWSHLIYLCRWTGTLIADELGVYDPASPNDRMLLGIRGQVSELERESLVHRMVEARWNKARRGEASAVPPAGYELDEHAQFQLTSDEAVQDAVRRVFDKFDELGAARQIWRWWNAELARAHDLGRNLDEVWHASTTTVRDRKRLLRALVDEVQIATDEARHRVRIVWKGGAVTDRELTRFRHGDGQRRPHATSDEIIELVRTLASEFDDAQIARTLNRQGHRSGLGLAFTRSSVSSLRHKHHIPACPLPKVRDEREGPFTADEAARELGVSMNTVHRWLREGVLAGRQATPKAPWCAAKKPASLLLSL